MDIMHRKTGILRGRLLIAALLLLGVVASFGKAPAAAPPVIAPSPCDPLYYDSLESRGWLEAQREITQNQNLIFKADSVLEYTCFDRFANELAQHARDMFSESTRWGGVLSAASMDRALDRQVRSGLGHAARRPGR